MKKLKFDSKIIPFMKDGTITSTWRIDDDKDITLNDQIQCVDKDTGRIFGIITVKEITIKNLGDLNDNDNQGYKKFRSKNAIYDHFQNYYDKEVDTYTAVKIIRYAFSKKTDNVVKKITSLTEVKLFTDGGSRGNPGPSASGFVILDMEDNIVINNGIYIGITTNNQAEYQALKFGLEEANRAHIKVVHVYMDSLLVINQMLGIFKVKNRDLWPIYESIKETVQLFDKVTFTHVPREYNKLADAEVNKTLDANV